MGKTQGSLINPVTDRPVTDYNTSTKYSEKLLKKIAHIFIKRGLLFFIFGFLLGRAFILSTLSPFSLPFFAAAFFLRRDRAPAIYIGVITGALSISIANAIYTFGIMSLFLVINKLLSKTFKNQFKALPYYVFASVLIGRNVWHFIEIFDITIYNVLICTVEAGLALVLTLIFFQSIPLIQFSKRKSHLRTEEIVCLIILLASIMTGTINWQIEGLLVSNILARFTVLLLAYIAGATVGATVGVVTGLIFGLASVEYISEMSLLAFAGLLGGLLKEGKRIGVAFGLLIGTLLMGMYGSGIEKLIISLYESLFATLLFFAMPKTLIINIAKYIPGTSEYSNEQNVYLRKVRDATARRVEQFSSVFDALAKSFSKVDIQPQIEDDAEIDLYLSRVTEKTCQTCFKKEQCWARNFNTTYDGLKGMLAELDSNGRLSPSAIKNWKSHCSRSERVFDVMKEELHYYQANHKLKKQLYESRKLVAEQLSGVSDVMSNFAKEIQKERENHEKQEEQLLDMLHSFGLEIDHIEVYSLEQGNVDIDITIPYCDGMGQCEKLIAPLLSDILGETITVHKEECGKDPFDVCYANFRSAKAFIVETGVAHAAKNGGFISGDSYSMIEIGAGKYALAISDGMGNGEKAHEESRETLNLLKKILQSGIDEEVAIKSINSILSLRSSEEIYATLDLVIIDLQDANSKFLKVGSTPSFIKRGRKVVKVQANNLPIGILKEFEVDVVNEQLKAEDLLIMMSDGLFEGPKHIENVELWLKRKIQEIETSDPQSVADLIMEEVIRAKGGQITDDMTVLVAKIKHNNPKWKSIPIHAIRNLA